MAATFSAQALLTVLLACLLGPDRVIAQAPLSPDQLRDALRQLERIQDLSSILLNPIQLHQRDVGGFRLCVPAPPSSSVDILSLSYCCPGAESAGPEPSGRPYPGQPLTLKRPSTVWQLRQEECERPGLNPYKDTAPGKGSTANIRASLAEVLATWHAGPSPFAPPTGPSLGGDHPGGGDWNATEVTWEEMLELGMLDPDIVASILRQLGLQQDLIRLALEAIRLLEGVHVDRILEEVLGFSDRSAAFGNNVVQTVMKSQVHFDWVKGFSVPVTIVFMLLACVYVLLYRAARSFKYKGISAEFKAERMRHAPNWSTCIGLWCVCCSCFKWWKKFHPQIQSSKPVPPARTGRPGKWKRSSYYWAMVDVYTARVRWPLLGALVFCQQLHRTQTTYDIWFSPYRNEVYDAVIYVLFLVWVVLIAGWARVFLVGNNSVHNPIWLLGGSFAIITQTIWPIILYMATASLDIKIPSMTWFDIFVDTAFSVTIWIGMILLFLEHKRGIGGHLSEVEQACKKYLKDRCNQRVPSNVRCKLCGEEVRDDHTDKAKHWNERHACIGNLPMDWTCPLEDDTSLSFTTVDLNDMQAWWTSPKGHPRASMGQDSSPLASVPVSSTNTWAFRSEVASQSMPPLRLGRNPTDSLATGMQHPGMQVGRNARDSLATEPLVGQMATGQTARSVRLPRPSVATVRTGNKVRVPRASLATAGPFKHLGTSSLATGFGKSFKLARKRLGSIAQQARTKLFMQEDESETDHEGKQKVPVFMSTLLLLAVLVPIMKVLPEGLMHLSNSSSQLTAMDKLVRLGTDCDVWTHTYSAYPDRGELLTDTCAHLLNSTDIANMTAGQVTFNFLEPMTTGSTSSVHMLGQAVRTCTRGDSPLRHKVDDRDPAGISACATGVGNIVDALLHSDDDEYYSAFKQAQWLVSANKSSGPPDAMMDAKAVYEGYGHLWNYEPEWRPLVDLLETLTNHTMASQSQRLLLSEVMTPRLDEASPVAIQFWLRFNPQELESATNVAALASGSAVIWVDLLLILIAPSIPAEWRQVARRAVFNATLHENVPIDNFADSELHRVVMNDLLPLSWWGVNIATVLSLIYAARLMINLSVAFKVRLREIFLQRSLHPDRTFQPLPKDVSYFEATLFPGYCVSTVWMSSCVCYYFILWPFVWAGIRRLPGIGPTFDQWMWNKMYPVMMMMAAKMGLRYFVFEKFFVDQHGDMKDLPKYNFSLYALVAANFVIAQYYGVYRAIMAMFFSMNRCARVDKVAMPYFWDTAFHSFEGVVGLAAKEYNPTKRVMLKLIAGEEIYSNWYVREARTNSANTRPSEVTLPLSMPLQRRDHTSRAKIRWHLALLLLRNPMLQLHRKQRLQAEYERLLAEDANMPTWRQRMMLLASGPNRNGNGDVNQQGSQDGVEMVSLPSYWQTPEGNAPRPVLQAPEGQAGRPIRWQAAEVLREQDSSTRTVRDSDSFIS